MRRWLATSLLFLSLCAAWPAQALLGRDVIEVCDSDSTLLERGEAAETRGDPKEAIRSYQDLLRCYPTSPYERRASARLGWLRERIYGDAGLLSEFLKVRNKRDVTHDELVAFWQEAEKFPSGRVKREAAAFAAEALAGRMMDPAASIPVYAAWLQDPALDHSEREIATAGAAMAKWKTGNLSGAIELLRSSGLTDRPEWRFLKVQAFRRIAHPIALALVGLFGLLAAWVLVRGFRQLRWREVLASRAWFLAAYVIVFPCVLAVRFSSPLLHDYQRLAFGMAAALGVSILAGLGAQTAGTGTRRLLAASAFLCCLAVGLLVAEQTEMLEGFMRWYGV